MRASESPGLDGLHSATSARSSIFDIPAGPEPASEADSHSFQLGLALTIGNHGFLSVEGRVCENDAS